MHMDFQSHYLGTRGILLLEKSWENVPANMVGFKSTLTQGERLTPSLDKEVQNSGCFQVFHKCLFTRYQCYYFSSAMKVAGEVIGKCI